MKKITRKVGLISAIILLALIAFVLYQFLMPQRDVVSLAADYSISVNELVDEYLVNPNKANQKYLDAEGDSKILTVSGRVANIEKDLAGNTVILLKDKNGKAGVRCTFTNETNNQTKNLKTSDKIMIKGVIRSGATYDTDLQLYEDVILEKCSIIQSIKM